MLLKIIYNKLVTFFPGHFISANFVQRHEDKYRNDLLAGIKIKKHQLQTDADSALSRQVMCRYLNIDRVTQLAMLPVFSPFFVRSSERSTLLLYAAIL